MLEAFTPEQIRRIAPLEYERWLREHQAMGWRSGDFYDLAPVPRDVGEKSYRAALREERIISHYHEHLSEYEKQKNYQPFNNLLKLMRKFDGVRIYRYDT